MAGGVGTHETALASPDRVDLGGRCVMPGFSDAHVHFPSWAAAQREVRLEDTASLDETLQRVAEAAGSVEPGRWLRGRGWRGGDWSPAVEPTRQALDAVTGDTPTALMARNYHSLWLNSAALAQADGELRVDGGVVEVDGDGEPTGVLRESPPGCSATATCSPSDDEFVDAMREGLRVAASRGVTAVHDKDGWLGAPRLWQRLAEEGPLTLRVWQSLPYDFISRLEEIGFRSGLGDDRLRIGYLKVFMDGTLGSQTARLLDGSGVEITSREELAEIVRAGARGGWPVAVHAIGDLANRDALDAFEETRDEWAPLGLRPRIEHAQLLTEEDIPRFGQLGVSASVQFSHAPSDRDIADRKWAGMTERAYAYRSLLDTGAVVANGSDAPIESSTRWPASGLECSARSMSAMPGTRSRRSRSRRRSKRRSSPRPGSRTRSARAESSCPGTSPTSSSSTATRWRSSRRSYPTSRSSQRWSAAAGRTTHHPGPNGSDPVKLTG